MAFESVQIVSTRNGSSAVTGFRQDLLAGETVGLSLSSTVGITSVLWELLGRPEFSAAGGAGPEPVVLATAPTSSFVVDADSGSVHKDGTYLVRATINPGSPGQVRKTCAVARVSGLTIPGPSGALALRKPGGFEALEDTSNPNCRQGYATPENRWHELVRSMASGGGVIETLAGAYSVGSSAVDQTLLLNNANGGGVVIDGSSGGFTGASALRINTAAAGPFVVDRATGNIGIGIAAPLEELHVKSASPGIRLDRTGGAAISLENITDVINLINRTGPVTIATFPGTGGMRTDFGVGIGAAAPTAAALAMGAGSTVPNSGANTGRFRYNEVAQQFEVSQNGSAYTPLGAGAASVLETDGIVTGAVQLSTLAFPATGAVYAHVKSVRDLFYLDRTSTLTADGITIVTALGGIGRWIRMCLVDSSWYAQLSWGLDPAGTFGTPGNDEAIGDFTHPLKSMAEWRRRNRGAVWDTTAPTIKLLSPSIVLDDGLIDGVTTPNSTTFITILGSPTVLFSGTVSSYQAYSGNTRGSFVDTALSSWTGAGGISTTSGGRFVRRQGTGARPQGPLIKDMGSKTVMFDVLGSWDETSTGLANIPTEVDLSNSDTYEVYSVPAFPFLQTSGNVNVRAQCLEVQTKQLSGVLSGSPSSRGGVLTYVLCSFGRGVNFNTLMGNGNRLYSCVFTAVPPEGTSTLGQPIFAHCAFVNTILELSAFGGTTTGTKNVSVNSEFRWWHGNAAGSLGEWRLYDCTTPLISVRHNSTLNIVGPIVGSGNSGALVSVDTGGIVYGAEAISATTSAVNYSVSGVSYPAPVADARTGDAIYNRSTGGQFLVPDATNSQAAVPLHQVSSLITAGALALTPGSIPFAANPSGTLTQDNANFFWDATNIRLGIGTATPGTIVDVTRTQAGPVTVRVTNPGLAANSDAVFNVGNDGTAAAAYGITGKNWVEGGGTLPNRGPNMAFLTTTTNGPAPTLYLGSHGVITIQTGTTQAERIKVLATGEVQLSSLAAGGMVKAAAGGQLGIGVAGTDFLAPPVSMTAGSVLFAGAAGAVAQDNANLFWDDTNNRLGIGTNTPARDLDITRGGTDNTLIRVQYTGSSATGGAQIIANIASGTTVQMGVTSSGFTSSGLQPNLGASTPFIITGVTSVGPLYIGTFNGITMQTGGTQAERLKIDSSGNISLSSLAAGGIAKAAATTGQLSIAVSGTDYLAPATALTTGSVLFAGVAGAVAQDNANFFWDDTNNRLGVGTNAPGQVLHVLQTGNFNTIAVLQNLGTGALSQAQFSAHNGTSAAALGVTGASFVAGGLEPNLGAATAYLRTSGAASTLYLGSFGVITMQTGGTQAERLKIDLSGNVSISSLAAGGVVVADPTTGKLGIGSGGGGGGALGMVTTGGSSAFNLSTLPSGVLEHVVTSSVSAPTSIAMTPGQIPFGAAANGLLAQDANLFWDTTNKRLGIGTNAPLNEVTLTLNLNRAIAYVINNPNTGTGANAFFNAQVGPYGAATATMSMGMTGANYPGSSGIPNLTGNMAVVTTITPGPSPTLYLGSFGVITMQTGSVSQAERLRILATGEVRLSSLAAGGLVKAAGGTGQLGIGLVTTPDITDQNVTLTKLEPIGPSKVLGFDGGTGPTGSPFDMTVIAPLRVPTGQGQLVFDTQFTQGAVVFQGATQIAQDPSAFFWNATNHRLGIGTNVPIVDLDVRNDSDVITTTMVRNQGAGTHAQAQFVATNSAGGGIGIAVGIAGSGFTATTSRPLVIAGMPYVVPHFGSQNLYMGAPGTLIFATGTPIETNRLQILGNGLINVSSLSAGGVVQAVASSGQLSALTMVAGQVPFGAASGGGLAQDAHLVWDNTNKRLGLGANIGSPSFDLSVVNTINGSATVAVTNGSAGAQAVAQFIAQQSGTIGMFGATGSGYTPTIGQPNLGPLTAFLQNNNGNPLYIAGLVDITFQTGNPQAEVMRLLSTGETVVHGKLSGGTAPATELVLQGTTHATRGHVTSLDPLGVGRSAGSVGGAPMFAVAGNVTVNSFAGASLDWAVFNTSTVTITGGTNITNANGFNWFTVQPPVYSTSVIIGAGGSTPSAATLSITGAPTITGGGSFAGAVGSVGLWVKGGAQLEGNLRMGSGSIIVNAGDVIANGTIGGNDIQTITGRSAGSFFVGTSPIWAINASVDAGPSNPKLGFFSAAPVTRPVVGGSRSSGTALQNLLAQLSHTVGGLGLIDDVSTP